MSLFLALAGLLSLTSGGIGSQDMQAYSLKKCVIQTTGNFVLQPSGTTTGNVFIKNATVKSTDLTLNGATVTLDRAKLDCRRLIISSTVTRLRIGRRVRITCQEFDITGGGVLNVVRKHRFWVFNGSLSVNYKYSGLANRVVLMPHKKRLWVSILPN